MEREQHDRRVRLEKEIILRIFGYGISLTTALSGFTLDWWGRVATGGWTIRTQR